MMNDAVIPVRQTGSTDVFKAFYHSGEDERRVRYDDIEKAVFAQKCMCVYRCRKKIYDVMIMRRKETIYLKRTGAGK